MILGGFAEPEDECCEVESGPVAGGEFVEAGCDGAERRRCGPCGGRGRRPPARPRRIRLDFWSALSGITARLPRRRSVRRIAPDEYALSAMTASGLRRGRPTPARGTRTAAGTASKAVESLTLPGVTRTARGRPRPSQARWTLVVSPPRDRPSVWSAAARAGSSSSSPAPAPFLRAPAACWWARLIVESTETVHPTAPTESSRTWSPSSRRAQVPSASQRANRSWTVCHGPKRSGRSRHGTPVRNRHNTPLTTCR
jgi:hypothetical protein